MLLANWHERQEGSLPDSNQQMFFVACTHKITCALQEIILPSLLVVPSKSPTDVLTASSEVPMDSYLLLYVILSLRLSSGSG